MKHIESRNYIVHLVKLGAFPLLIFKDNVYCAIDRDRNALVYTITVYYYCIVFPRIILSINNRDL